YIVGVTGNVMQADIDVFMQAGADSVLAKPLRVEQFDCMMASLDSKSKPGTPRRETSTQAGLSLTLSMPDAIPQHSPNETPAVSPSSVLFRLSPRAVKIGANPDQQDNSSKREASSVISSVVSVSDNTHNV
ncbi:hypothetical protein B484DRAFT_404645, partial [Ochromonadaceae sp. CCMP2298]